MIESVGPKGVALAPAAPQAAEGVEKPAAKKDVSAIPHVTPINPRLRYDAVSGVVITEFLDQTGGIQAQSPSSAVMAYLRAGLGEDGRGREEKI